MNPEISATGDIEFQFPEGESLQVVPREFELAFQANLDPYSATKIFVSFEDGEVSIEEGYIYWTGLPAHLRVDAGVFRQEVGELNRWHLHALPESDYPLVYRALPGKRRARRGRPLDLYRAAIFRRAWHARSSGCRARRSPAIRCTLESAGPPCSATSRTSGNSPAAPISSSGSRDWGARPEGDTLGSRVLGMDFRLTWRPPNAGTRQDLTLRAEGYQFHANELGVSTDRYGMFADINYKASRRWVLGLRYDYVEAPRGVYSSVWGLTPTITWWQSEFVFLRLEDDYRYDSVLGHRKPGAAAGRMGPRAPQARDLLRMDHMLIAALIAPDGRLRRRRELTRPRSRSSPASRPTAPLPGRWWATRAR